jgi:hypothetical protein
MFYTIIPETPPVFAVQPNDPTLNAFSAGELIGRLQKHFMSRIVLVSWDQAGQFKSYGHSLPESVLTDEDLQWREFELPAEPEIPF